MKPILVGQAPSRGADDVPPFGGRSGKRIAAMAGVDHARLLDVFDAVNLLERWPGPRGKGDLFPLREARRRAAILTSMLTGRTVVLVGQGVARAFGQDSTPLSRLSGGLCGFVVPHPSGLNRWYNDASNVSAASAMLKTLAGSD